MYQLAQPAIKNASHSKNSTLMKSPIDQLMLALYWPILSFKVRHPERSRVSGEAKDLASSSPKAIHGVLHSVKLHSS
jgi:hypothetical protein